MEYPGKPLICAYIYIYIFPVHSFMVGQATAKMGGYACMYIPRGPVRLSLLSPVPVHVSLGLLGFKEERRGGEGRGGGTGRVRGMVEV